MIHYHYTSYSQVITLLMICSRHSTPLCLYINHCVAMCGMGEGGNTFKIVQKLMGIA